MKELRKTELITGWGLLHTGFEVAGGRTSYWKVWTYTSRVFKRESSDSI